MHIKLLLPAFLFFILLTIYSLTIPFFWDGTFFSKLSVLFYENGFNGFIAPQEVDTGGFPLFSIYLSILWKVFGKTLLVSHIVMLPFLWGIVYEFFKLAKRFLNENILPLSLLLLMVEPTFITQSILMGYDILMLYFFLLSLNGLLDKKHNLYRIGLVLLCLSTTRGIMLGCSLFLIDLAINYMNTKKLHLKFSCYSTAIIGVLLWTIYHWQQTGWLFFSPERENTHEALLPLTMMLRQFIFIGWKLIDFGRIALWLFFIGGFLFFYKNKAFAFNLKIVALLVFIPVLATSFFMAPLSNPIGHRYFMFTYLTLIIGVCYIFQHIKNKKIVYGLMTVFLISSLTGNFWLYPQRYGNGWDSSLKVLPFFQLKDKMDEYIQQKNIAAWEVGTQFPLIADKRFSHLSPVSYHYINVWRGPIDNYRYFLESNVINTDIPEQIESVKREWSLLKEFKSGQVYLRLYENKQKITPAISQ